MRKMSVVSLAVLLVGLAAQQAEASDLSAPSWISEIKGGVMLHDIDRPEPLKDAEKNSFDLNLEVLSQPLKMAETSSSALNILLQPRAHLGGAVNMDGYTNHYYAGLTWTAESDMGLYAALDFGGAVHSGKLNYKDDITVPGFGYLIDDHPRLGSRILFHEGFEVGYHLPSGHGIAAAVSHMSNAGLVGENNDGMTFASLRYTYRFNK